MASREAVSVFAEGTFQEHLADLTAYAAQSQPEADSAAFSQKYTDLLQAQGEQIESDQEKQRTVFSAFVKDVSSLGSGTTPEIEGFFNLVSCYLFALYPADQDARPHLDHILRVVSESPAQKKLIKHRVLSNLFTVISPRSSLRLPVYKALLALAIEDGTLDNLRPSPLEAEKRLSEWGISEEDKQKLLKAISEAYVQTSQPDLSYQFLLSYARSIRPSSSDAQRAGTDAVVAALRLPSNFDFDPLLKLDPVVALKGTPLFSLLEIFLNSGLTEYRTWASANASVLEEHNLNGTQLERKIRLLTLASLAFTHIGKEVLYSQLATALQVESNQVERWFIDAIRAGLVSGKLSQTSQSARVSRATARVFEREQWETLEKRLVAWKTGLAGVLEVVAVARRQGSIGHNSAQAQTVAA